MIYFTYKIQFTNADGHPCSVSHTKSCENVDYDATLEQVKLLVTQQAWAVNNFDLVTNFSETINFITLAEYNKIVTGPNTDVPIADWDPSVPLDNSNNQ